VPVRTFAAARGTGAAGLGFGSDSRVGAGGVTGEKKEAYLAKCAVRLSSVRRFRFPAGDH
jgi:hypothetical protein